VIEERTIERKQEDHYKIAASINISTQGLNGLCLKSRFAGIFYGSVL
jgi:hypothetical protein